MEHPPLGGLKNARTTRRSSLRRWEARQGDSDTRASRLQVGRRGGALRQPLLRLTRRVYPPVAAPKATRVRPTLVLLPPYPPFPENLTLVNARDARVCFHFARQQGRQTHFLGQRLAGVEGF